MCPVSEEISVRELRAITRVLAIINGAQYDGCHGSAVRFTLVSAIPWSRSVPSIGSSCRLAELSAVLCIFKTGDLEGMMIIDNTIINGKERSRET